MSTEKLMAANRSEIAIRIFRAANELGIKTVAIYAEEDRFSRHRFKADESYQLNKEKGPVGAYLDIEGIVALAKSKGVTMIHPGYGFLAENAEFARACEREGIIFIGPSAELLENMGDKVTARKLAKKYEVPVLPGTEDPISDPKEAHAIAKEIGFPLIIKAAYGGGGRGMRIVEKEEQLEERLAEAQKEAESAFGNPAVFLERYIARAKHIEVQIMGDKHGNVVHLYERDCSVQRRFQKVVEIAPSINLEETVRADMCDAAVRLAAGIGYDNAGTIEFLYDMDRKDWFFIEMNPRIQVEHTVTECITGVDLVRSQILVAKGLNLFEEEVGIPHQADIPCIGYAIQCRITSEDPARNFAPDYGRIISYRSAAGFGIRLDAGGAGDAGSEITPFYDSLLVKIVAMGRTFPLACQRMGRALREFRVRGVKTNIPFLENVLKDPLFASGEAHTKMIDSKPELFVFRPRRDRATKLLAYLADVTVNGNPVSKGWKPLEIMRRPVVPHVKADTSGNPQTRVLLKELGPEKFAQWMREQKRLLVTDTSMRDAHQSLMATRMRTNDMLRIAEAYQKGVPSMFSMEMWGGATFDASMRFLKEDPWQRLRRLRELIPGILFQMLFRGSNAVGYSNYPDNVVTGFVKHAADVGIDIFRIFDSMNYLPNMQMAMEAVREHGDVLCEAAICYTGDILDERRTKFTLKYYVEKAKELERMGAHILGIKDMAGLCKPQAAYRLVKALKEEVGIPIHYHTHDTPGLNAASVIAAARAGVDAADLAMASMSGSTSQPNLNSVCAALANSESDPQLDFDTLNDISDYWDEVLKQYVPFISAPRAGTAEVYEHEMPGGQYTNLREQANAMGLGHRWREIAHTYAEVNQLFGDLIKVTPSSKAVGDMAMFLITRGIKPADVTKLKPGSVDWPESVIDMLAGGLGQPEGGFPEDVVNVILNDKPRTTKRPGELAEPVDLEATRKKLAKEFNRNINDDALYAHLMYPQVFADFQESLTKYDSLMGLPSPAFFYGMHVGEEIDVEIDPGKTLFIKLVSIGEANVEGERTLFFELNGMPRETVIIDRSLAKDGGAARRKGDPNNLSQVCAPMPGMVSEVVVAPGQEVMEGEKLIVLEAMKMLTTVSAGKNGVVKEVLAMKGEQVDSDDLLVIIEDE